LASRDILGFQYASPKDLYFVLKGFAAVVHLLLCSINLHRNFVSRVALNAILF
jgi:hypothetical protein